MIILDDMTLIAGSEIAYQDICRIRQPSLRDIRDIGYDTYQDYLSIILIDKDSLLGFLNIAQTEETDALPLYSIICAIPALRESYCNALNFFTSTGDIVKWRNGQLEINGILIGQNVLDDIASAVAQMSNIEKDTSSQHVFASEKARKIWEKCQKGKKNLRRAKKEDVNYSIPNVISSVSSSNTGYTLLNIWGLTVYQLYDQFSRIVQKIQMDVYSSRWAAWGKDDFDTTIWFKNSLKKEG